MPWLTPVEEFMVRSHFPEPVSWEGLSFGGAVRHALRLSMDEIRELPRRTVIATLECAGNGRAYLEPPTGGVQWQLGAVGTASWTGTPLRLLLDQVGLGPDVVDLVFSARDIGPAGSKEAVRYERSLSVSDAMRDDIILAYEMNGRPLTSDHGAPLRLIVPGWYGAASVKWLEHVTAIGERFQGHFQVEDYVVRREGRVEPCREMAVRSIILSPVAGASIGLDSIEIRGLAWSGLGPVEAVEVAIDPDRIHLRAELDESRGAYAWRLWSADWKPPSPGPYTITSQARDAAGRVQRAGQLWNPGGYANNASVPIQVHVES
ncbi:MAG TPA: sulfite oxidase [Chloroflexota bacterium]|nr:sulfite oxidase [Chloroflexota bacterium]